MCTPPPGEAWCVCRLKLELALWALWLHHVTPQPTTSLPDALHAPEIPDGTRCGC